MEIITSHNVLDFDGLAAMVAASKLYPQAVMVFSGTLSPNVKRFMALYKDSLTVRTAKQIDLQQVSRVIVVDTASLARLGHLKKAGFRNDTDFHVYDHHPAFTNDIKGSLVQMHIVGACTTIMTEKIIEEGVDISSFDATILALGIYEDTGSLLFSSTTPRDVSAVAYLLSRGANLKVVANFMEQPFSRDQRVLLQELLNNLRHHTVKNMDIVIAIYDGNQFISGLDKVTSHIMELENSDIVFVIALMENKINVVSRARTSNVKLNEVIRPLGGRGHEKAAAAVVKGKNIEQVVQVIIEGLGEKVNPGLLACDIMSTPVKTIPMFITMEEAGRIMLRYGHTGMPVVEGNKIVGVISRRDVDKAKIHELGHAPVKGFMTTKVLTIAPDATVPEIQQLMVAYDIGRLPVVEEERLVGIVSRTDILRTLHGDDYPEDHKVLYSWDENEMENCLELMQKNLPTTIMTVLQTVGEIAEALNCKVYCVGGFVRDLILRVANFDVDLVVEGDGELLANELAQRLGGRARIHHRFKTAVVVLPDESKIDIATARTEYYEFPAALPMVEKSSLKEDLYRRDFTINTLAIALNPSRFGDLIDYFGSLKDLKRGFIRILYNLSFVEDPTRILRAVRFEQRYRFTIEPDTLRFAQDAIQRRLLGKLSYKRILQELILILEEKNPLPPLQRLEEIGVWIYILPDVNVKKVRTDILRRVPAVTGWWMENSHKTHIRIWLIYVMVLLADLTDEQIETVIERYRFEQYVRKSILDSRAIDAIIGQIKLYNPMMPGRIHDLINGWNDETVIYLLLCVKEQNVWESIAHYLHVREYTKVILNGNDLKTMGLKPGPIYNRILNELYLYRLNGIIKSRQDEERLVRLWLKEEKFSDGNTI